MVENNTKEVVDDMKREAALDPARPTVLITRSNRGVDLGLAQKYAADV